MMMTLRNVGATVGGEIELVFSNQKQKYNEIYSYVFLQPIFNGNI